MSALPTPADLAERAPAERHAFLESVRGELYDLAAVVADETFARARREAPAFPPYGLAQSRFTALRAVSDHPEPYPEGSVPDYLALGRALVDTTVFHLDGCLAEMRRSDQAASLRRLDQLLGLFRVDADQTAGGTSRVRDPFSFLYGGMHFGVSVCVEMAEVMDRVLAAKGFTEPEARASVMRRSTRPLHQLASLNLDDVPAVYRLLHGGSGQWLAPERFAVVNAEEGKRVDFRSDALPHGRSHTYRTRGCPARHRPGAGAGAGPITGLWSWTVDLAVATGVLRAL